VPSNTEQILFCRSDDFDDADDRKFKVRSFSSSRFDVI